MNSVTVQELSALEHPLLIDVRERDEFVLAHVPGAINIPLSEFLDRWGEIPEADEVYVICAIGGRSAQATQYLNGIDVPAVNVTGGTIAWQSAGLPTDSGLD